MGAKLEGTNLRGLQALSKRIRAGQVSVFVGVPATAEPEEDGTSLALVAAVNEFGSSDGKIPERSFLRAGIRENRQEFIELNRKNLMQVVEGRMTEERALSLLGAKAANAVQKKIISGPFEPNKQATIDRKGSSRPLVDSGHLRASITWALEGRDAGGGEFGGGVE